MLGMFDPWELIRLGPYILKVTPILEKIEDAEAKLKNINADNDLIGYIDFGSRSYKGVPEILYLKGLKFIYTSFHISDELIKKYSDFNTLEEATSRYQQFEILERYRDDLEKAVKELY